MGSLLSNESTVDYSEDSSNSESEDEMDAHGSTPSTDEDEYLIPSDEFDNTSDNICFDSATDALDAVPSATMLASLTLNQVLTVENQLDVYEKVSLVYLLYEDPHSAFEDLNRLLGGSQEKLLYNWALGRNLKAQKWQEKFIEAVCIIKNYQVLTDLGFMRNDLDERFLPHLYFASLAINKIRKSLYLLVCEDMDSSEVEMLVQKVRVDFSVKKLQFKMFDVAYLELFLLYWEHLGYISQDNLSNLCAVLKQMEKFDTSDYLKGVVPVQQVIVKNKTIDAVTDKVSIIKNGENIFDKILSPRSLTDFISSESNVSADNAVHVSRENKYAIDLNNPGYCLIINQENFYREIDKQFQDLLPPNDTKLDSRLGTQKDKEVLEATFKKFGFRTEVVNDLVHLDLLQKIEESINKIENESSLFVCIMSHGDEGVVYGVNSCRVSVKKIQSIMCHKNRDHLSGKPKVLILQSCQGNRCQKLSTVEDQDDIVTDGPSSPAREMIPPMADLFTFWATVPGYGAIRNKKTGSWFIQSLCKKMKDLGNQHHFEDICTMVVQDVSSKKWNQPKEEVAMVPLKEGTFRKLLYLPPMIL